MILAIITFLTGLAISSVAIYYSVLGLSAIFSAAALPIIIMGTILELSKLVSAWWLKSNWKRAPFFLKSYMLIAVIVLMLITSMGIFGFLSRAHSDQAIPTGDIASQISVIDEKIKIERENIDNARSLIAQLDGVVNAMTTGQDRTARRKDGTEFTISSAERALTTRRSQSKDRAALTKQVEESQQSIIAMQKEKAPIASSLRKVEAEVGPIKYIAAFVYGDNPDANILEKAVTWVIMIIVFVFDPLAILLLLASQMSFQWAMEKKKEYPEDILSTPFFEDEPKYEPDDGPLTEEQIEQIVESAPKPVQHHPDTHPYLREGFKGAKNLKPVVHKAEGDSPQDPTDIFTSISTVTDTPLFVQNEEQLLSKIRPALNTAQYIAQSRSLTAAERVIFWANLVRTKKVKMVDVPRELLLEVRAVV